MPTQPLKGKFMHTQHMPIVGIYRTIFPAASEPFIVNQAKALRSYRPLLIARHSNASTPELEILSLFSSHRSAGAQAFTLTGWGLAERQKQTLRRLRLINAHFAPDGLVALSVARSVGVPLVVTCHGSDITLANMARVRSLRVSEFRYLARKAALIEGASLFLACSDFLRAKMIDVGYPRDKVVRHYIGVDTAAIRALAVSEDMSDSNYILSVARHSEVKGVDVLLHAFALLSQRFPTLRLVQIGDGPERRSLMRLSQTMGISNRVDFLGALPPAMVFKLLARARCLVLSSRRAADGSEEAFGLVLIEAQAAGIPVVATRVGGIPEAVCDGVTGLLVPPDSPEDLASAMHLLLEDRSLAASFGNRGREYVAECFDLHRQTKRLEVLYDTVSPA